MEINLKRIFFEDALNITYDIPFMNTHKIPIWGFYFAQISGQETFEDRID